MENIEKNIENINSEQEKKKSRKLEKFGFFFLFPLVFLVVVAAIVVLALFYGDDDVHQLIELVTSAQGIVKFILVPYAIIIIYLIILVMARGGTQIIYRDAPAPAPQEEQQETSQMPEFAPAVVKFEIPKSTNKRPKPTVDDILEKVEVLKQKPRVTGKMVMGVAQKLEKFKNQVAYRGDEYNQKRMREALNWCYEKLGNITYETKTK